MTSCFTGRHDPYVDPMFSITTRFNQSTNSKKVNLGVGAYRDHNGKPYVLNVVKKAEIKLANDPTQNKEYLDMGGLSSFVNGTLNLVFGKCDDIATGLIQGAQSLSGTGACRMAFDLLHKFHNVQTFYCSDPTWPIHNSALAFMGVKDIRKYKYYDNDSAKIHWDELVKSLSSAPEGSAIVLHGCGHNPTGLDLEEEQWRDIIKILIERKLIPILDLAYMGFVTGDLEKDAYAPRLLHSLGKEMLVCISFSKNMGLYNERVGVLCWYAKEKSVADGLMDRVRYIARNTYSNPPAHGAKVVSMIVNDPALMREWGDEMKIMSQRIASMRKGLHDRLVKLKTPGDWSIILKQQGLFSYTGITKQQVQYLEKEHHIFMIDTGRINVSALTEMNLDYVANAIHDAVTKFPKQS